MLYSITFTLEIVIFSETFNVFGYLKQPILNMAEILMENINMHVPRKKYMAKSKNENQVI